MTRIRSGPTKAALIIAGFAMALVLGFLVEVMAGTGWGAAAAGAAALATVAVAARTFRGENESDAPREWWRMSAYPAAGFVSAGWFVLQTIAAVAAAPQGRSRPGRVSWCRP